MSAEVPFLPLAHLAHWAAVLYAAPVIVLGLWALVARFRASQREKARSEEGDSPSNKKSPS